MIKYKNEKARELKTDICYIVYIEQNNIKFVYLYILVCNTYSQLGLGKVPLTNGGFRKLTEVSANEQQKPLIFKTLTEQISRLLKKIND